MIGILSCFKFNCKAIIIFYFKVLFYNLNNFFFKYLCSKFITIELFNCLINRFMYHLITFGFSTILYISVKEKILSKNTCLSLFYILYNIINYIYINTLLHYCFSYFFNKN